MIINLSVTGKAPLSSADLVFPQVAYATTSGISASLLSAFCGFSLEMHLLVPDGTTTPTIDEIRATVMAGYVREGWTNVVVTSF